MFTFVALRIGRGGQFKRSGQSPDSWSARNLPQPPLWRSIEPLVSIAL